MQHDGVGGAGHGEGDGAAGPEGAERDGKGVGGETPGHGDWGAEVSEEINHRWGGVVWCDGLR